jgi:cell division protein FtsL
VGQDRKDGKDGGADVRIEAVRAGPRVVFRREIKTAVRYEKGLFLKALVILAILAIVLVLRMLYVA